MSFVRTALVTAALCIAQAAGAQSPAEHVTAGDRDYQAMNAAGALAHYEAAIKGDARNYDALWKAARSAIDVGENTADKGRQKAIYAQAEQYARRAMEANPRDAEGHFMLARALGRTALSLGSSDRIKYAGEVRAHALEALRINPKHAGALHVMGVWNAEVMRLSGVKRWAAKNLLGGKVFDEASWKEAQRYMEEAVRVDPDRLTHKLDLARIYRDTDQKAKARAMYDAVVKGQATEANDAKYKREAAAELKGL